MKEKRIVVLFIFEILLVMGLVVTLSTKRLTNVSYTEDVTLNKTRIQATFQSEYDTRVNGLEAQFSQMMTDTAISNLIYKESFLPLQQLFKKRDFRYQYFILDNRKNPVLFSDFHGSLKALDLNRNYTNSQLLMGSDAIFRIQVSPLKTNKRTLFVGVFDIISYTTPYFPSTAVLPSFTSELAGELSLSSVPVPKQNPTAELNNGSDPVIKLKSSADSLFFTINEADIITGGNKVVRSEALIFSLSIILFLILLNLVLYSIMVSLQTSNNAQVIALVTGFGLTFTILFNNNISGVFFPADFLKVAVFLSAQTFGLLDTLSKWMTFSIFLAGFGLISLGFEAGKNESKPGPFTFYIWVIAVSVYLSLIVIFLNTITEAIVLDGFIKETPLTFSVNNHDFWIYISMVSMVIGFYTFLWVSYKVWLIALYRLKPFEYFFVIGLSAVSFLIPVLLNPVSNYAIGMVFAGGWFIFIVTLMYSLFTRLNWKRTGVGFYQIAFIVVMGFIPVFFILMINQDDRLDQLQRNTAIQLSNPQEGFIDFLSEDVLALVTNKIKESNIFSLPEKDSDAAYETWLQSQAGKEKVNFRLRIINRNLTALSRWQIGNLPVIKGTEDTLLINQYLKRQDSIPQLLKFKKSLNQMEWIQYIKGYQTDTTDSITGFVMLEMSESGQQSDLASFGITGYGDEDPQVEQVNVGFYRNRIIENSQAFRLLPPKLSQGAWQNILENGQLTYRYFIESRAYNIFFFVSESDPGRVIAVSRPILTVGSIWNQFSEHIMAMIIALVILYIITLVFRWIKFGRLLLNFRERVTAGVILASFIPFWGLIIFVEQSFESQAVNASKLLLDNYYQGISPQIIRDFVQGSNSRLPGVQDYLVYEDRELKYSSRPEWPKLNIIPSWLPLSIRDKFLEESIMVEYASYNIRDLDYIVGYYRLPLATSSPVIVAIPNLLSKQITENEIFTARSYLVSGYVFFILFLLTFFSAWINWLLRPIKVIEGAFAKIGKQKEPVYVNIKGVPEIEDFGNAFNQMVDDLNRYKDSLATAERQLAWQEMAKQVAHEIKNPLTPLKLNAQMLKRLYRENPVAFNQSFSRITDLLISEIENIDRIAKTFATFSRMPEREVAPQDISLILSEVVDLFRSDEVEISIKELGHHKFVLGDRDEINRVFTNIIKNAIQAKKGEIAQIIISLKYEPQWLHLMITDWGTGIPQEIMTRIFEPNFSTKNSGMGLGLAISKKIIMEMHGNLLIKSQLNEYTTVYIDLPLIDL